MKSHNIAWAAGLFEGEGTITLGHNHRYKTPRPRLELQSTDFDVIRTFKRTIGVGCVCIRKKRIKRKPVLIWYTSQKSHIEKLLKQFLPYFGVRRNQRAKEVLKFTNYINRGWS